MRLVNDADSALAATIGSNPSRPWYPYLVPEDASDLALAMLDAPTLVLAFQDTVVVAAQRAAADEDGVTDEFDALLDIRSRLADELCRRLEEIDHQTQYRRLLAQQPQPRPRLAS